MADNNQPTPKTLQEAVRVALCCGPLSEVEDRILMAVQDFIAQKVTTQKFKAYKNGDKSLGDVIDSHLTELWNEIIKKEEPEPEVVQKATDDLAESWGLKPKGEE